jgi:hypothetical protein
MVKLIVLHNVLTVLDLRLIMVNDSLVSIEETPNNSREITKSGVKDNKRITDINSYLKMP